MIVSPYILDFPIDNLTIVINGLTGRIDIFKTKTWNLIKKYSKTNTLKALDHHLLNSLKNDAYLFSTPKDYQKLFNQQAKRLFEKQKKRKISLNINFSEDCNLSCPYCLNQSRRTGIKMSKQHIDNLFNFIKSTANNNHYHKEITLFGGEPLLLNNRQLIAHLFNIFKHDNSYQFYVVSNGVTIAHYINLFTSNRKLISKFQITLDGPAEIHDQRRVSTKYPKTFSIITNNIDLLLKHNFQTHIRINLDKRNIDYLPQLAKFIHQKGWPNFKNFNIYAGLVKPSPPRTCANKLLFNSIDLLKKISELKIKYPQTSIINDKRITDYNVKYLNNQIQNQPSTMTITCCASTGVKSFTFGADGFIYACEAAVGIKTFRLGKYFPKLIWNQKNLKLWKNRFTINMKKCQTCPLVFTCGGGCPLTAYEIKSDIYAPHCNHTHDNLYQFVQLNKNKINNIYLQKIGKTHSEPSILS